MCANSFLVVLTLTTVSDALTEALAQASAMNLWEGLAVVLALAYLLFAMRGSLWCWPAAFFSTLIYTVLFWEVSLLMESVLNGYYLLMALYGFWQWRYGGRGDGLSYQTWSASTHVRLIGLTALTALGLGYVMDNYTHADLAYLDSATTCFAVVGTVMTARKVVENWLYWVVIDLVSIYLYMSKGLVLTSGLFVIYVGLALASYFSWRSAYRTQGNAVAA
ncbi:nicotinamide mononucleotide transporter [Ferrimonas sediminum]|uniref:Nicotinamide riboside transporter PnuC n=2 Tax=Ferrimonas sediminum TaxID=718193 RepID=A0A1G8VNA1_9GAMM|nr:nicotinamide mononucleotide transporter [Ferrimonas sediminum]